MLELVAKLSERAGPDRWSTHIVSIFAAAGDDARRRAAGARSRTRKMDGVFIDVLLTGERRSRPVRLSRGERKRAARILRAAGVLSRLRDSVSEAEGEGGVDLLLLSRQ